MFRRTASDHEIDDKLIGYYRKIFSSSEGKIVLGHMLYELYFFNDEVREPEKIAKRNYATRLLKILGSMHPNKSVDAMIESFTKTLFKIPIPKEFKNK